MFFNAGNGWSHSQVSGSWMIRPVLGSTKGLMEVKEQNVASEINVYPNPTNGTTNVEIRGLENFKIIKVEIYDIFGECNYQQTTSSARLQIDLSTRPSGIYFLRIVDEKGFTYSKKVILTK
jgi:hypothetical protein